MWICSTFLNTWKCTSWVRSSKFTFYYFQSGCSFSWVQFWCKHVRNRMLHSQDMVISLMMWKNDLRKALRVWKSVQKYWCTNYFFMKTSFHLSRNLKYKYWRFQNRWNFKINLVTILHLLMCWVTYYDMALKIFNFLSQETLFFTLSDWVWYIIIIPFDQLLGLCPFMIMNILCFFRSVHPKPLPQQWIMWHCRW